MMLPDQAPIAGRAVRRGARQGRRSPRPWPTAARTGATGCATRRRATAAPSAAPTTGGRSATTAALSGVLRCGKGYAVAVPRRSAPSLGLVRAPRQESYGGFVFTSLAQARYQRRLGHATLAIDRLLDLSPTRTIDLRANWMKHLHHANWKMVVENNVDGYHALFTHASVYDAIKPAKVSHVPTKVDVLVRDIGKGHSEIDYSDEYRKLDERIRLVRSHPAGQSRQLCRCSRGCIRPGAGPRRTGGRPTTHTDLAQPLPGRDERHVRRPQAPDRTIAYTTAVLIPGQDALNERTLRRSEGAMVQPDS